MISQLKSNSVLWIKGKRVKTLLTPGSAYREFPLFVYGKNKTLKIARFVGIIQGLEKVAVVVVKEKRKKPCYLVSTNLHLSALDVVKYYANRWKIEQMIKDLKQRLGLGNYLVRDPPSSCGLSLPQLFRLNPSEDPPFGKRKNTPFDSSIHLLAFYLRRLPGCPMDNLDHRLSPKSL